MNVLTVREKEYLHKLSQNPAISDEHALSHMLNYREANHNNTKAQLKETNSWKGNNIDNTVDKEYREVLQSFSEQDFAKKVTSSVKKNPYKQIVPYVANGNIVFPSSSVNPKKHHVKKSANALSNASKFQTIESKTHQNFLEETLAVVVKELEILGVQAAQTGNQQNHRKFSTIRKVEEKEGSKKGETKYNDDDNDDGDDEDDDSLETMSQISFESHGSVDSLHF